MTQCQGSEPGIRVGVVEVHVNRRHGHLYPRGWVLEVSRWSGSHSLSPTGGVERLHSVCSFPARRSDVRTAHGVSKGPRGPAQVLTGTPGRGKRMGHPH